MNTYAPKKRKGFAVSMIPAFVMAIVIGGIFLGLGLTALSSLQGTQTDASAAYNATGDVITALGSGSTFFQLIVTVGFIAVAIGLLIGVWAWTSKGSGGAL